MDRIAILSLYKNNDTFSKQEQEDIFKAIDDWEIDTEEIYESFFSWVCPLTSEEVEDVLDYKQYYSNGLTHKENLIDLLEFITHKNS